MGQVHTAFAYIGVVAAVTGRQVEVATAETNIRPVTASDNIAAYVAKVLGRSRKGVGQPN